MWQLKCGKVNRCPMKEKASYENPKTATECSSCYSVHGSDVGVRACSKVRQCIRWWRPPAPGGWEGRARRWQRAGVVGPQRTARPTVCSTRGSAGHKDCVVCVIVKVDDWQARARRSDVMRVSAALSQSLPWTPAGSHVTADGQSTSTFSFVINRNRQFGHFFFPGTFPNIN